MEQEQSFFLQVLADFMNHRKTVCEVEVDWAKQLRWAKQHQLEGIYDYQCRALLPKEYQGRAAHSAAFQLFSYTNRERLLREVEQGLSDAGIPFYMVKGMAAAAFYPVPSLRAMGDCDLVVPPERKEEAHRVFLALGFENHSKGSAEWVYFRDEMEFELHHRLLYEHSVNTERSLEFSERAWQYARPTGSGSRYELDWSYHFVFLLLHLRKHLLYSGVGFRQFLDLAAVAGSGEVDWQQVEALLRSLELTAFARTCMGLCERWFGVRLPMSAPVDEDFFEESTEKIFGNGVFGFQDSRNRENPLMVRADRLGCGGLVWENLFPPYDAVREVPYYGFVRGRPWLLPLVWVYRPIRSLFYGKLPQQIAFFKAVAGLRENLPKHRSLLEKWGL